MRLTTSKKKDIKVLSKTLPNAYFMKSGQQIKINHKKRLESAFKADGYNGLEKYCERVKTAYWIAKRKNSIILFGD